MTDTTYRWDTVCFAAEHEDPDDLHEKLHQWIAQNFKLNHRGIPLHVMCMAARLLRFRMACHRLPPGRYRHFAVSKPGQRQLPELGG